MKKFIILAVLGYTVLFYQGCASDPSVPGIYSVKDKIPNNTPIAALDVQSEAEAEKVFHTLKAMMYQKLPIVDDQISYRNLEGKPVCSESYSIGAGVNSNYKNDIGFVYTKLKEVDCRQIDPRFQKYALEAYLGLGVENINGKFYLVMHSDNYKRTLNAQVLQIFNSIYIPEVVYLLKESDDERAKRYHINRQN